MAPRIKTYDLYKTFDEFIANVKIPEKKWKFFDNFVNEKSFTFGNAVKSYHDAGYTENNTSQYRAKDLYNSPLMQKLLHLYHIKMAKKRENASISVFDSTDNTLLWCIEAARRANDYKSAESAAMSRAKLHGQLVDKHQVIDPAADLAVNQSIKLEAAKMAETRLLGTQENPQEPAIIEAEFEEKPEENDTDNGMCTTNVYKDSAESALLSE